MPHIHHPNGFQTIRLRMGPEQPNAVLLDLAARCEEMVYASATDLNDYVRKIALKLLTVEARIPARNSTPPLPPRTPPLSPRRTVPHDEEEEEQDFEGGNANIASTSVNNNNIKI
ncbi:uncharacterized protein LOC109727053 isoform X2 [Ananas comosus]|uniref:Uncharacterized protein LOC109727053 isoform X2 n=1 Tax=Ananas comosus TaxID=4615 RepID=A0A6P5H4X1_ANACO|nr:uncharacterized protein LOC109727053 isoform X2 [Ananas comosus]